MKKFCNFALLTAGLLLTVGIGAAVMTRAQEPKAPTVFSNDSDKWLDCPGMPAGCKMLRLYGDPAQSGEFGVRFKYAAHYRIAPHTHGVDEHVTVISGGPFHVGVGDNFNVNTSAQTVHATDLAVVPAGVHHFAWADTETILQVNGFGPFKRDFLNPSQNGSGVPK